jgi:hypothetical protein
MKSVEWGGLYSRVSSTLEVEAEAKDHLSPRVQGRAESHSKILSLKKIRHAMPATQEAETGGSQFEVSPGKN